MKGLIINIGAATILFAGALFGALFATGRLNHEGTANIPLLSMLFPEPAGAPQLLDPQGKPMDAVAKDAGKPADAVQASGSSQDPKPQDPKGNTATKLKKGRSLVATEAPKGGEHGDKPEEHGAKPNEHGAKPTEHAAAPNGETEADASHAAEQDFADRKQELARDRTTRYSPGGYFRFDGMPAGLTPEKLNEAWARVQEVTADLEKRGKALDLRDRDLKLLADDIQRRWTELGKERSEVEGLQAKVDERIERFKEQVKLVRTDEVAGLKRNAQTLASLEPEKVAELIQAQWISDGGQDEVLKTLEFMSKDKVNEILAVLPNAMIRDLLQKRLKVSKEPAPNTASK
ncbi:MAG: hypothetical protein WCR59_01910 [Planctomycetota bacterium]